MTDAFAHCKFIGYSPESIAVLEKAGIAGDQDAACVTLGASGDAAAFLKACRALRFWDREPLVDLDAGA